MISSSFTVGYLGRDRKTHVVFGVTSIVPNLNGILMFTRDGENYQIESDELFDCGTLPDMFIEYSDSNDIAEYCEDSEHYVVHDHGIESDWL